MQTESTTRDKILGYVILSVYIGFFIAVTVIAG